MNAVFGSGCLVFWNFWFAAFLVEIPEVNSKVSLGSQFFVVFAKILSL